MAGVGVSRISDTPAVEYMRKAVQATAISKSQSANFNYMLKQGGWDMSIGA